MISESALLAKVPTQLYIGGQWIDGEAGGTIDVDDPATGQTLVSIADATPADGIRALDAAVDAAAAWAATPARVRGELLRAAWELLMERADEFALLMTLEMGKPFAEAKGEVTYGGEFLRWFAEEAPRITGRYGPNPEGTGR
ncbi:aldehyde dehydrogenase family protein, partial [Schumannella luteola]